MTNIKQFIKQQNPDYIKYEWLKIVIGGVVGFVGLYSLTVLLMCL
jgi:hypothetical protein